MHRKQPFSSKKKKQQLQQKRNKNQTKNAFPESIRPPMIFTPENLSEVDPSSNPSKTRDYVQNKIDGPLGI